MRRSAGLTSQNCATKSRLLHDVPEIAIANGGFRQNVPFAMAVSVDFQYLIMVEYAS